MSRAVRYWLAERLGGLAAEALLGSARFTLSGQEHLDAVNGREQPFIFVLWHSRILPLTYYMRNRGYVALVSQSGDGEYLARILERWGYQVVRGSSTRRGSTALKELVRHGREGRWLAFTPDGPRGPRQKLKAGVLLTAQLTGLPLVPIAAGANRAWWFEDWDRFLVPRPLARIHVAYGPPLSVPRDASRVDLGRYTALLETRLDSLLTEVDDAVAST